MQRRGGPAPFGFRWSDDRQLVPDPKEAPIRRLLVELFIEHRRIGTLASVLASRGMRTRSGAKFSETTILRLVREPAPGVVPTHLHEQCQALLADRAAGGRPAKLPVHLFTGAARCACGGSLHVPSSNPGKYVCPDCHRKTAADDIEAIIRRELGKIELADAEDEFDLPATWPHLSFEEKRSLIEHLVDRIVVGDGTITIWLYSLSTSQKHAADSHRTNEPPVPESPIGVPAAPPEPAAPARSRRKRGQAKAVEPQPAMEFAESLAGLPEVPELLAEPAPLQAPPAASAPAAERTPGAGVRVGNGVGNGDGLALDQLLTRKQLKTLVPVSDMTLWRWIKKGEFPQPIKRNGRTYWVAGEVQSWLARCARERNEALGNAAS